jgi:hypothetical protein
LGPTIESFPSWSEFFMNTVRPEALADPIAPMTVQPSVAAASRYRL